MVSTRISVVQVGVGQARQALKATLAEDLELTAHDRPLGGAGHVAESRVRLGQPRMSAPV